MRSLPVVSSHSVLLLFDLGYCEIDHKLKSHLSNSFRFIKCITILLYWPFPPGIFDIVLELTFSASESERDYFQVTTKMNKPWNQRMHYFEEIGKKYWTLSENTLQKSYSANVVKWETTEGWHKPKTES